MMWCSTSGPKKSVGFLKRIYFRHQVATIYFNLYTCIYIYIYMIHVWHCPQVFLDCEMAGLHPSGEWFSVGRILFRHGCFEGHRLSMGRRLSTWDLGRRKNAIGFFEAPGLLCIALPIIYLGWLRVVTLELRFHECSWRHRATLMSHVFGEVLLVEWCPRQSELWCFQPRHSSSGLAKYPQWRCLGNQLKVLVKVHLFSIQALADWPRFRISYPIYITGTYCWWKKSCTTWDVQNPVNNGMNYLSTGAGFLPSTVCQWNTPVFRVVSVHTGTSLLVHHSWILSVEAGDGGKAFCQQTWMKQLISSRPWIHWLNLPQGIWKNIQKPAWEYHESSNFCSIFLMDRMISKLDGLKCIATRWTSAKVSVASRAHFQYHLRSNHVCTQLSGSSNCSAATLLTWNVAENTQNCINGQYFKGNTFQFLLIFSIQLRNIAKKHPPKPQKNPEVHELWTPMRWDFTASCDFRTSGVDGLHFW